MNELDPIEKLFQTQSENYSEEPPKMVWEKIAKKLDHKKLKKKPKPPLFIATVLAVFLVILTAIILWFLVFHAK